MLHPLGGNHTSTRLPGCLGEIFCCVKCCRQSSSTSDVAVPGGAACSARGLAGMARSRSAAPRDILVGRSLSTREIWASELCCLPDMQRWCAPSPALRTRSKLWQQMEAPRKHPGGFREGDQRAGGAASYDPIRRSFSDPLRSRFDTCELSRSAGRIGCAKTGRCDRNQANNLRRLKALYIDRGREGSVNLLYGARRFVRRMNEFGIAHRYEEFPDNHTASTTGWTKPAFSCQALSG